MSERKNNSHEKLQTATSVTAHLGRVAKRGPVLIEDLHHAAVHGTSLESMLYVVKHGVLPGSTYEPTLGDVPGDIFIYPTQHLAHVASQLDTGDLILDTITKKKGKASSTGYAKDRAVHHAALKALGFTIDNEDAFVAFIDFDISDRTDFFTKQGISKDQVKEAVEKARERSGFILGIDPKVVTSGSVQVMKGDNYFDDMRIRTFGRGLDVSLISGIEPQGEIERIFLHDITTSDDLGKTIAYWDQPGIDLQTVKKDPISIFLSQPSSTEHAIFERYGVNDPPNPAVIKNTDIQPEIDE